MAHFARVNAQGIVENVIVAEQEYIDTLPDATSWVQTSYNTHGGVHYGQNGEPDGGIPLRKNFASVGYKYDAERDAFISEQPYPSWILNEDTCQWNPPTPCPTDGKNYIWNEETQTWNEVIY